MQERLNLDELKFIENKTNELIKSWQKLNRDFLLLEQRFNELNNDYEELKIKSQNELSANKEDAANQLQIIQSEWQEKYQLSIEKLNAEKKALLIDFENERSELIAKFQEEKQIIENELNEVNNRNQHFISRIRGLE